MSHSQFHSIKSFILRHAWLNLWDKRMLLAESTRLLSQLQLAPSTPTHHTHSCLRIQSRNCLNLHAEEGRFNTGIFKRLKASSWTNLASTKKYSQLTAFYHAKSLLQPTPINLCGKRVIVPWTFGLSHLPCLDQNTHLHKAGAARIKAKWAATVNRWCDEQFQGESLTKTNTPWIAVLDIALCIFYLPVQELAVQNFPMNCASQSCYGPAS